MDAIIVIIMLFLTFPIVSLFHELGHYMAARGLGMQVERIQLGTGKALSKWKQKGVEYQFNWNCFLGGHTIIKDEEHYAKGKRVIFALGGILLSVLLYIISWEIYHRVFFDFSPLLHQWLYIFVVMNLYMAAVQLFPFRKGMRRNHPGYPSDGLMLLQLLLSKAQTSSKKQKVTNKKIKRK